MKNANMSPHTPILHGAVASTSKKSPCDVDLGDGQDGHMTPREDQRWDENYGGLEGLKQPLPKNCSNKRKERLRCGV